MYQCIDKQYFCKQCFGTAQVQYLVSAALLHGHSLSQQWDQSCDFMCYMQVLANLLQASTAACQEMLVSNTSASVKTCLHITRGINRVWKAVLLGHSKRQHDKLPCTYAPMFQALVRIGLTRCMCVCLPLVAGRGLHQCTQASSYKSQ